MLIIGNFFKVQFCRFTRVKKCIKTVNTYKRLKKSDFVLCRCCRKQSMCNTHYVSSIVGAFKKAFFLRGILNKK